MPLWGVYIKLSRSRRCLTLLVLVRATDAAAAAAAVGSSSSSMLAILRCGSSKGWNWPKRLSVCV